MVDNYIGRRLNNRYFIREIIGIGGMSVVYKAYDEIDDRIVAIKLLKEEYLSNEEFRRNFKNESKAVAVLNHVNIVKVYDVCFSDNLQYIVMEYVDGVTLKEYIQNKKVIGWTEVVYFALQILKALQHAHDKGIVHRDIKPQNIIILPNGTLKVTDFGIARLNRTDANSLPEGGALGSVHYMSPEQARGEYTDEKTDIYSVGVVLYEMLTGQLPFQSDSAVSVAIMQLQKNAIMPRAINSSIPVGIEQITMRAMQKNPRDRYQSAAEMILDLEEFKRNPNIKFDYTYFVDKEPTKYISTSNTDVQIINGNQTDKSKSSWQMNLNNTADDTETDTLDSKSRRNKIIVIIVVAVLAVCAAGFCIWYFVIRSTGELIVPDFTGMTLEEVYETYPEFEDYIEENAVYSTEYEEGIIFNQSVAAGTDLSTLSNKVIKLDYATSGNTVQILEFDELTDLATYTKQLQLLGFVVELSAMVSTEYDVGTIISTDPTAGTYALIGSTVVITYATDEETIAVPYLIGLTEDEAIEELTSLGFDEDNITFKTQTVDDESLADLVVYQSVDSSTLVDPSSATITLYIGEYVAETDAECSFTLPDISEYDTSKYTVTIYDSDDNEITKSSVVLDGSEYAFTVSGTGTETYHAVIDDQTVCTITVNFSSSPASITVSTVVFDYTPEEVESETETETVAETTTTETTTAETTTTDKTVTLPDVAGLTEAQAINLVAAYGFGDYEVVYISSTTYEEGLAITCESSSLETSFTPAEALVEKIIIYVSTGA